MKERVRMLSAVIPCFLVLFSVIVFPGKVRAEYPEKPLTLVIGFEPGATVDIIARALALGAKTALKQIIVVENKGGGGGTVALSVLATIKPDGYTVACRYQQCPY